jgi:hypothetical protein
MSEDPMSKEPNRAAPEAPSEKMLKEPTKAEAAHGDTPKDDASGVEEAEDEGFDDNDYIPIFIQRLIDDPPVLPNESKSEFLQVFESYEFPHNGRPKTDVEYLLVYQATTITFELLRLERMQADIVKMQRRPAAEIIYRMASDDVATTDELKDVRAAARKNGRRYFADPEYRKTYVAKLEESGYGAGAVEAEAFRRSLPSVTTLERQKAGLQRRLFDVLKRLDAAFATRDPEMKMPKSLSAKCASGDD